MDMLKYIVHKEIRKLKGQTIFDAIIIGAGPSGLQSALYLARAGKNIIVLHSASKGALLSADKIQNFYGVGEVPGKRLYDKGLNEIKKLGVNVKNTIVTDISYDVDRMHYVVGDNSSHYRAKTIILAMGKESSKKLGFEVKATTGVSYCATCDGFFYRNKQVAVIGNSEYTLSEHNHLLNVTSNIDVLTNDEKISPAVSNIESVIAKEIVSISNTPRNRVKVVFKDKTSAIYDAVFIAVGDYAASAIARTLGVYVENGFVVVNDKMSTNVPGVFACGDMIGGVFQIAKAVCDGMMTGLSVIEYLNQNKN